MTSELAIDMDGVEKSYRFFKLSGLRLQLAPGQIMGFVGPNGAGKSTTMRMLMALIQQDRGEVRVLGHAMPQQQVRAKWDVGYVSEDMRLYGFETLGWHMKFVASIYPGWDAKYAQTLLHRFNLKPEQMVRHLSHGERVKATLLLVLARRPRLLLLDEPTTGLDPVARHELLTELLDVLNDERRAILFSSHNTQDIEQICDQIAFIDRGRLIEVSEKEDVLDRWRRVQLEVPAGTRLPELPGVIDLKHNGRFAVATTSAYRPHINSAYEQAGVRVAEVQRMTLEEIFVARVMNSRKEVAA
jgi:ABC-2 type transport system ATP-binding protein